MFNDYRSVAEGVSMSASAVRPWHKMLDYKNVGYVIKTPNGH